MSLLEKITIKEPCSESWDEMTGNAEVRFCSHCSKNVNNLVGMTRERAEDLIERSGGRLCVRYVPPQTVIVDAGTFLPTSSRSRIAAGVLAGTLALSSLALGQAPDPDTKPRAAAVSPDKNPDGLPRVFGVLLDANGAVIPGASVKLTNTKTSEVMQATSDVDGNFEFRRVAEGDYQVEIEAVGFKKLMIVNLRVEGDVQLKPEIEVNFHEVVVGLILIAEPPHPLLIESEAEQTGTDDQILLRRPSSVFPKFSEIQEELPIVPIPSKEDYPMFPSRRNERAEKRRNLPKDK